MSHSNQTYNSSSSGKSMDVSRMHDPKYIGPGAWYALHLMCSNADTPEGYRAALHLIHLYATKFACAKCQRHLAEFCAIDPPENYSGADGLFLWSWRCHNNANTLTGKGLLPYDDAYDLFFGKDAVCTAKCGEESAPVAATPGFTMVPVNNY